MKSSAGSNASETKSSNNNNNCAKSAADDAHPSIEARDQGKQPTQQIARINSDEHARSDEIGPEWKPKPKNRDNKTQQPKVDKPLPPDHHISRDVPSKPKTYKRDATSPPTDLKDGIPSRRESAKEPSTSKDNKSIPPTETDDSQTQKRCMFKHLHQLWCGTNDY